MEHAQYNHPNTQKMAAFGGIYGNIPAFEACIADAKDNHCDTLMFLGDAVGCFGHSDEVLSLIHQQCDIYIEPLKTGIWTTGVNSLPQVEKQRYHFA